MLKEIQKSQYNLDAFYLRHFKQLPTGVAFDDLFHEQKEFIMLLTASAPSLEGLGAWLEYEKKKEVILSTDYSKHIGTIEDVRRLHAQSKGIGLDDYDTQMAKAIQDEELAKLAKNYGIETETEEEVDDTQDLLQKYSEIAKNLEQNKETKKLDNLDKLFKRPIEDNAKI